MESGWPRQGHALALMRGQPRRYPRSIRGISKPSASLYRFQHMPKNIVEMESFLD